MTTEEIIATTVAATGGLGLLIAFASMAVARAANAINSKSALQQIQVAERELYLSLVEKRTRWYADYRNAFMDRQLEVRLQIHRQVEGREFHRLPHERALMELTQEALWLFGSEVMDCLWEIDRAQHNALMAYREFIEAGNERLHDRDVGPEAEHFDQAHAGFGKLSDHLENYLYVGDIKRQLQVTTSPEN